MRDTRFITSLRGGPLSKEKHRQLMHWARACAAHALPLLEKKTDKRLDDALRIAKEWEKGNSSVGRARNAAVDAHEVARKATNPVAVYVARAVGHAVATAHMADHSLGAAWYALKAKKAAGKSVAAEQKWQDRRLAAGIRKLVLSARKKRHLRI
jgi:hypothetical protein